MLAYYEGLSDGVPYADAATPTIDEQLKSLQNKLDEKRTTNALLKFNDLIARRFGFKGATQLLETGGGKKKTVPVRYTRQGRAYTGNVATRPIKAQVVAKRRHRNKIARATRRAHR